MCGSGTRYGFMKTQGSFNPTYDHEHMSIASYFTIQFKLCLDYFIRIQDKILSHSYGSQIISW